MNKTIVSGFAAFLILISGINTVYGDLLPGGGEESINLQNFKELAIQTVRAGLTDPDPSVKMHAIEVVATTETKELLPVVLKMLDDPAITTRFSAAVAMGDVKYKAATYKLKEMLGDSDENVRMAAAYALMEMGEKDLEAHILKGFIASTDSTVKANAAMLLGKLGDTRALPPLWNILKDINADYKVQVQAVESIAMLKDEKIYQKLWALMISKYVDDRIMGVRAMGALGTLEAKSALVKMLGDDIDDVKLCAAYELGKLNSKTGLPEVLDFFTAKSAQLASLESSPASHLGIMAIGSIKSPRLNVFLPKLLANTRKDIKLAAAQSVLMNVR